MKYDLKSVRPLRVISVTSGKGGVGKTLTSINFAIAARQLGQRVLILDGDFGLSNVNVVLGLEARYNISSVLDSMVSIREIMLDGPLGVKIIPSGSGVSRLADLSQTQRVQVFDAMTEIYQEFDLMIIDTGAGISQNVVHLNRFADANVVVTNSEPHALTDAYAMIKVLSQETKRKTFSLLVNQVANDSEGIKVHRRFADTALRFLNVKVDYAGSIPQDATIQRLVQNRQIHGSNLAQTRAGQAWNEAFSVISGSQVRRHGRSADTVWRELVWASQSCEQGLPRFGRDTLRGAAS